MRVIICDDCKLPVDPHALIMIYEDGINFDYHMFCWRELVAVYPTIRSRRIHAATRNG